MKTIKEKFEEWAGESTNELMYEFSLFSGGYYSAQEEMEERLKDIEKIAVEYSEELKDQIGYTGPEIREYFKKWGVE